MGKIVVPCRKIIINMTPKTVYTIILPKVYSIPFQKIRFLFSISLLIKPIAVILVAIGQGLTAVNKPSKNAMTTGHELFSKSD
jgi:hypothetical protein